MSFDRRRVPVRTTFVSTVVVVLMFLLGASAAQAADVIFDPDVERKAIGVMDLEFEGIFYDVTFPEQMTAEDIYGPAPDGDVYTFTSANIYDAVQAVNAALNADPGNIPFYVGEENGATDESTQVYLVGYGFTNIGPGVLKSINGAAQPGEGTTPIKRSQSGGARRT